MPGCRHSGRRPADILDPDINKACLADQALVDTRRGEHECAHPAAANDHLLTPEQSGDRDRIGEQDLTAANDKPTPLA